MREMVFEMNSNRLELNSNIIWIEAWNEFRKIQNEFEHKMLILCWRFSSTCLAGGLIPHIPAPSDIDVLALLCL